MSSQPYLMQIDIHDKPCLVVGGGPIALHKSRHLVDSGAKVTVVSTSFHAKFDELNLAQRHERAFEDTDIEGIILVQASTQHLDINKHIANLCVNQNIPCCVANDTSAGTFATPAILDDGNLRVAVSTNGLSPSYGARLRREIKAQLPDYIDDYLIFLGEKRAISKEAIEDVSMRMRFNAYLASAEFGVLYVTLEDEALDEMVHALLEQPETIPEEYIPKWG